MHECTTQFSPDKWHSNFMSILQVDSLAELHAWLHIWVEGTVLETYCLVTMCLQTDFLVMAARAPTYEAVWVPQKSTFPLTQASGRFGCLALNKSVLMRYLGLHVALHKLTSMQVQSIWALFPEFCGRRLKLDGDSIVTKVWPEFYNAALITQNHHCVPRHLG